MASKVRVAIIGLGFGAEFIPIYQQHPDAEMYGICRRDKAEMDKVGDRFKIANRYTDFKDVLNDPNVDAVHINSPIADHAPQSIAALKAGKHVACTVPAATTIDECRQIVEAQRASGKVYMMMETVVYSREYLFARELYDKGELGRIDESLIPKYGSPFAIETATFKLRDSDVCAEVTRSLFDTARQYRESFDAYGSTKSFEWQQVDGEEPVIHTRGLPEPEIPKRVSVPDYAHLLPKPIQRFTTKGVYDAEGEQHLSFTQGGGHGGSHPHLVHAWLSAIR